MTVIHHQNKDSYLTSLKSKSLSEKPNLATANAAKAMKTPEPDVINETNAKVVQPKAPESIEAASESSTSTSSDVFDKAKSVAKKLVQTPPLPIAVPSPISLKKEAREVNDSKKIDEIRKKAAPPLQKPAVIFIEGFELFSRGDDGIKEMSEAIKGAKNFSWSEHQKIIEEIKKHDERQPVVLVGHSFGADTAIEVANELNSPKHGFRNIDLLVTLDAVGFNHHVIPVNVQRNANYFAEGSIPLLHGTAHVAKNPKHTDVYNELRDESHTAIDDSHDLQYEIFEQIKDVISPKEIPELREIELGDINIILVKES